MYAVIATGGKQYKVHVGDELDVEKLDAEADSTVTLTPIMLVDDDTVTTDASALEGAKVTATVVDHHRARKVVVFKYKNKTRYRRKNGHRQSLTRIRVDEITA